MVKGNLLRGRQAQRYKIDNPGVPAGSMRSYLIGRVFQHNRPKVADQDSSTSGIIVSNEG